MAGFLGSALRSSLPWDRFAVFVRRRLEEAAGIGCVALAALVALALATHHPADPSFTFAAPGTPRNWLGGFGARLSDILFQSVGLAAWIVGLAFLAWGWRFASHRGLDRVWLKLATLAIGLLLAAAALAALGAPEGALVPTGYGGLAGKLLHDRIAGVVAAVGLADFTGWVGVAVAVPAAGLLFVALGLAPAEWLGIGRGIAAAGRVGGRAGAWTGRHALATGRAAAGLIHFRRGDRRDRPAPAPDKARRERVEPRLDGAPPRKAERPAAEPPRPPRAAPPEKPREAARAPERERERDDAELVATPRRRAGAAKRAEPRQASLALDHDGYTLPPLDLLDPPPDDDGDSELNEEALAANARLLESVLEDFGVRGEIVKVRPGPVVTLYELEPAPGTKSSRVIGLADDIARSMSAVSVRVAVIPGRTVIGIELPNSRREVISLRDILSSEACERTTGRLTLALGKDIGGTPQIADLARMPHLLIAGTTGSGKSVAINSMILSLLYRLPPEQCRFIMIDPKMLELSVYDGIPHLLAPVVTDPGKAVVALRWAVREMETRYRAMSQLGVRNIAGYNARLEEARKSGETLMRTVQTGFDAETGEPL
ncbi:MAG: DNA translocase FtsK 4TM domain-containing protein, partial [Rhodospirillaceae bacterium]